MNNTTTAPLNDGAQMSGNNTANNQNTITLNRNDVGEYKSLIADLVLEGFWGYFKAQPVAIAILGERMQHTKSIPEREALSRFVGAIEQINDFVYGIIESRPALNEIHEILNGIEGNAHFIVTD